MSPYCWRQLTVTFKGKLGFCFPQKSRVPFGTAAGRNIWISPCTDLLNFKVLTSGEGTEDSQLSAEHSRLHHHRCQLEQQNTANEGDLECVEREYLCHLQPWDLSQFQG